GLGPFPPPAADRLRVGRRLVRPVPDPRVLARAAAAVLALAATAAALLGDVVQRDAAPAQRGVRQGRGKDGAAGRAAAPHRRSPCRLAWGAGAGWAAGWGCSGLLAASSCSSKAASQSRTISSLTVLSSASICGDRAERSATGHPSWLAARC